MGISTDFDYSNLLSLDKAKLVKRKRMNFLGSKELTLDYNIQTGGTKEEAVSWLEANRLTLTDPSFGFKTYEGTWKCIDIEFNEDAKIIRQRFKIDSSLLNDVSERSASGTVEKSYYWRVVDPSTIELPASVDAGITYTKNATDNGDGTYDVVVAKQNVGDGTGVYVLDSVSYSEDAFSRNWTELYKNTVEIVSQTWLANQATLYAADPTTAYFNPDLSGGVYYVPIGFYIDIKNSPLDNGLFDASVFVSEAKQSISDYVFVSQTPVSIREKMGYNIPSASVTDFMTGVNDFSDLPATTPLLWDVGMSGSINRYGLMDMRTTERLD